MVEPKEVKLVMSHGEEAISFEKRRIARHSLVQEIDYLQHVLLRRPAANSPNIIGARIELESDEIGGGLFLNRQSLRSCDFGVQSFGDFLRDLALNGKQIVQIAVVLLGPDMGVSARVDQLRVQTKMRAGSADAALQNMRYTQIIADLTEISFATIIHHTRPADDFQIGDLRQLGQNVVLHTIDKDAPSSFCSLRFSNGRTAIPFVTGRRINSLFQMIQPAAAASAISDAASSALVGFRRTHFLPRRKIPVCRAKIGSCFSQRSKSSASARADE